MMGVHRQQSELFSYQVNLDKRVRADHPLRRVAAAIDFTFVRTAVAFSYGHNGHVSTDPVILLKMMFLLFWDNIPSERELMSVIPERLDYLWFLGYGLDDVIPNHSVLSKARKRWGNEAFETFFIRTVEQCIEAGLVDGSKIHVDSSLIAAHASRDSVLKGPPELIAALKKAYQAQESKLEDSSTPENYEAVNDRIVSTTDPDASIARKGGEPARPAYHHHRVVDDEHGVITAVETTPGAIAENKKLMSLIDQHEANTRCQVRTAIADHKYGTAENFVACQHRDIRTHLGDVLSRQKKETNGLFDDTAFQYQPQSNTYLCPAGQTMIARRLHAVRRTIEFSVPKGACLKCPLRKQCTTSKTGRTIQRHEHYDLLQRARNQSHSARGRKDRKRRQILIEGSFADAANNHGFKRSRWRRLWRQQIQDWIIAGIQNIRTMLNSIPKRGTAAMAMFLLRRVLDFGHELPSRLVLAPLAAPVNATLAPIWIKNF